MLTATTEMDQCPTCLEIKPLAEFGRNRRRAAHCVDECITCQGVCRAAREEARRERGRQRRADEKAAVFGHYGQSCACCGTAERLCIDHVNGDGERHRAEVGQWRIYRWLISNGFPGGFQTLCNPCNGSKRGGTHCRRKHDG